MTTTRIALANLRFPGSPDESVTLAVDAITQAGRDGAAVICFPECYIPGYRLLSKQVPPPDAAFLEHAWSTVADAAAQAGVVVVLGTERIIDGAPR
ncbi:MAG TPA: nitrilase-related carbon-nitrogen hydrolase, partial [Gemmatimonadales bacterium]|nr:nitrilase-related carbon-nitrogen hydrolase [Gemmatimonadales bacterium]